MAIAKNKNVQCVRLALLSTMFPVMKDGSLMLTNGKQAVFVSEKEMNTLKYCTNIKSICAAAGVSVDLTQYATGKEDEAAVASRVYDAISGKYLDAENMEERFAYIEAVAGELSTIASNTDFAEDVSVAVQELEENVESIVKARKNKGLEAERE